MKQNRGRLGKRGSSNKLVVDRSDKEQTPLTVLERRVDLQQKRPGSRRVKGATTGEESSRLISSLGMDSEVRPPKK